MVDRNNNGTFAEGNKIGKGRIKGSVNLKTLLTALVNQDIERLDYLAEKGCVTPRQAKILDHMNRGLVARALGDEGDKSSIDLKAIDMIYDRLEGKALAKTQEVPTTLEDALKGLEEETVNE